MEFVTPIDIEADRFPATERAQMLEATPSLDLAGFLHAKLQAVRQKAEGVYQRALSNTVPPDDRREGRQWRGACRVREPAKPHVLQRAIVADAESLELGHSKRLVQFVHQQLQPRRARRPTQAAAMR